MLPSGLQGPLSIIWSKGAGVLANFFRLKLPQVTIL